MARQPERAAAHVPGADEQAREFNLEPRHLTLLIVLVLGLCTASFLLGRWVERRAIGPTVRVGGDDAGGVVEEGGDVSKDLTFFDTLKGGEPAPLRPSQPEALGEAVTVPSRTLPREQAASTAGGGSPSRDRRSVGQGLMIQVMASKDRAAAESLRKRLRAKGYTAILVSDGGTYKVRVGPYADREEAERAGAVLREQEKVQVWIP